MNSHKEKLNKRASRVIEKWGIEGEMSQLKLNYVAKSYLRIQVKNRIMKWFALGGLFFVAIFIGLMLGSVVIGMNISKEFKIKDGDLVQSGKNNIIIQTSEKNYGLDLKLSTPLDVIRGIKTFKVDLKDGKGSLSFGVVSIYYIKGRKLQLYGHSHMANVLANGTVEVFPINHQNGQRRIDESKRVDTSSASATTTTPTTQSTDIQNIYDCQGLQNMQRNGKYSLENDIECVLSKPLFYNSGEAFEGSLEGNGNTITVSMKVNGVAAVFGVLKGATISNVLFRGNVTGVSYCAGIAVQTLPGTTFFSTGVYTNITCSNNGNETVTSATYSAVLLNPTNDNTPIVWRYAVSQSKITLELSMSVPTFQAGYYGRVLPNQKVVTNFTYSYSASVFDVRQLDYGRISFYGFKSQPTKKDIYVPEDCYNFDKTNANYLNMCINWYKQYRFENQECCSDFNSCPYIYCSYASRVCMICRSKRSDNTGFFEIIPVVNKNNLVTKN